MGQDRFPEVLLIGLHMTRAGGHVQIVSQASLSPHPLDLYTILPHSQAPSQLFIGESLLHGSSCAHYVTFQNEKAKFRLLFNRLHVLCFCISQSPPPPYMIVVSYLVPLLLLFWAPVRIMKSFLPPFYPWRHACEETYQALRILCATKRGTGHTCISTPLLALPNCHITVHLFESLHT